MSCVEVLGLAPLEPTRVTENESRQAECPIDLELAWIKDYTGNFAMEDSHLLAPTLDMALECNAGHYEANPHRLQSESRYGDYGRNDSSTREARTRSRYDHGDRGRCLGQATQQTEQHPGTN